MKILKFGGKSLAYGDGFDKAINIILDKVKQQEKFAVVVSAIGNATDELEEILEKAKKNGVYQVQLENFKTYQKGNSAVDLSSEFGLLEKLFEGVALLGDYSKKIKDNVLAQGEVISGKVVTQALKEKGVNANFSDTRQLIKTDAKFGNAQPVDVISRKNVQNYFSSHNGTTVNVVTGFIASSTDGETTTLGRNGSNFTASLLANYLDAEELQSFTHVDGIFTANPDLVPDAKKIDQLSFEEANEIATFGATILHAKTIIPLIEKKIPLRILNTFNHTHNGTLISSENSRKGIKSLSVLENVTLVNLEGRGLLGKPGIDARIFRVLAQNNISVSIISQGSSERGIGLVVDAKDAQKAKDAIEAEFELDFYTHDVSSVYLTENVSVISIIGQELATFNKPYDALIRNQIVPILFNNTITGKNVSLVMERVQLKKALNVIHSEIFGITKKVNLVIFGHGTVGKTLINQLLETRENIIQRKGIELNIVAIANSRQFIFDAKGVSKAWQSELESSSHKSSVEEILKAAKEHHLGNLIAIDATANKDFVANYVELIKNGFDLVSANKIANTKEFSFYKNLRENLNFYQKNYLYETNVGAGLPLIDTIRLLHHSGENITRIRGVFSGTLSYLFNTFSAFDKNFSDVLNEAIEKGFTEPDPREDLNGNDVGRKLLILARELDLSNEFSEVKIQNLIPENLREGSVSDFLARLEAFNPIYQDIKNNQAENHVLRYVGDLSGDLSVENGATLEVSLVSVPKESSLGQLKGSDSIFEIYTESYGEHPIVIQGAGAGAAVTARGVFGDILRLAEKSK
ncbi:bifunctional aspartate kinase/homoserine dehydrogenase I [Flavobacterium saliperosum]|uniref:Aspartate kinase n=1 Tax=Flavobacterium saliperosum TaxID=329186 RepID=A0A1G4VVP4_9FLAO|nr:bifunctional aspartate kinase/homoserine dehydrogenase I [Flavobacterium saliperosum]SCX12574.1 aspartate kinase [Flavobacterium saliperosum]